MFDFSEGENDNYFETEGAGLRSTSISISTIVLDDEMMDCHRPFCACAL